jgi:hypothetical protein
MRTATTKRFTEAAPTENVATGRLAIAGCGASRRLMQNSHS